MLGGNVVENFMDKLAQKISASDIIKANAQAEAAEAERTKQEAQQYKQQLEELRLNEQAHRSALEDTKASLEEAKATINETKDSISSLSKRIDENETQVHDVGVQVYRNVQAIVEKGQEKNRDEFKELNRRGEAIQVAIETKNSAAIPLLVIVLLVSGADLVINILRILGII
ncbi:hypothetical protein [Butyrivibrio sp. AE2032]|uniref:hypothetical protein n=1 Tax=Butyrivibrio sp. AE2032 TaxID=1458463 RepID=UPI0005577B3C|nr:hypothetical protein [Butyrivibrio sp. AE2032]